MIDEEGNRCVELEAGGVISIIASDPLVGIGLRWGAVRTTIHITPDEAERLAGLLLIATKEQ